MLCSAGVALAFPFASARLSGWHPGRGAAAGRGGPDHPAARRVLSGPQRQSIAYCLRYHAKEFDRLSVCAARDAEARAYAGQFLEIVDDAGLRTRPGGVAADAPVDADRWEPGDVDLVVTYRTDAAVGRNRVAARQLQRFLERAGLQSRVEAIGARAPAPVNLVVLARPVGSADRPAPASGQSR